MCGHQEPIKLLSKTKCNYNPQNETFRKNKLLQWRRRRLLRPAARHAARRSGMRAAGQLKDEVRQRAGVPQGVCPPDGQPAANRYGEGARVDDGA